MNQKLHIGEAVLDAARRQVENESQFRPTATSERKSVTTVRSAALHDLQIRAQVEGHSFIADEAFAKGGHDAGPAPMRYFLGGLMMCHQVWCIKLAALRGLALDSLDGEISCYVVAASPDDSFGGGRVLDLIRYSVMLEGEITAEDAEALVQEALRLCPAFGTVSRGAEVVVGVVLNGAPANEITYPPGAAPRLG